MKIPPPDLLHKVNGNTNQNHFARVAEQFVTDIEKALERAKQPLRSMKKVLDFGCGCGRPIQWLIPAYPGIQFKGCDADAAAITWCADNLKGASFQAIEPFPPAPFADGEFDLVYMISVFTHIDADHQLSWLPEVRRILAPGGTFLFTVHGQSVWRQRFSPDAKAEMEQKGFAFGAGGPWKKIFPDWYGTAFHSEEWIRDKMVPTFRMLDYAEKALNDHHDIAVMSRD